MINESRPNPVVGAQPNYFLETIADGQCGEVIQIFSKKLLLFNN